MQNVCLARRANTAARCRRQSWPPCRRSSSQSFSTPSGRCTSTCTRRSTCRGHQTSGGLRAEVGFLKIISIGIPTYAGVNKRFLGLMSAWKPVFMPAWVRMLTEIIFYNPSLGTSHVDQRVFYFPSRLFFKNPPKCSYDACSITIQLYG